MNETELQKCEVLIDGVWNKLYTQGQERHEDKAEMPEKEIYTKKFTFTERKEKKKDKFI